MRRPPSTNSSGLSRSNTSTGESPRPPAPTTVGEWLRLPDVLADDLYAVPELVPRAGAGDAVLAHVVLLALRQYDGDTTPGGVVEAEHALRDVHVRAAHQVEGAPQKAHVLRRGGLYRQSGAARPVCR